MTLANCLTLVRILGAPGVLILLLKGRAEAAFWLYAAIAVTDSVDGIVARWMGQETRLGALLDPLADKVLMITVYPGLVLKGLLEAWVFAVFVSRDLVVLLGWGLTYVLLGDALPRTRRLGKVSSAGQMLLAALLLLAAAYPGAGTRLGTLVTALPPLAVALAVSSMLDYIVTGGRRFGPS